MTSRKTDGSSSGMWMCRIRLVTFGVSSLLLPDAELAETGDPLCDTPTNTPRLRILVAYLRVRSAISDVVAVGRRWISVIMLRSSASSDGHSLHLVERHALVDHRARLKHVVEQLANRMYSGLCPRCSFAGPAGRTVPPPPDRIHPVHEVEDERIDVDHLGEFGLFVEELVIRLQDRCRRI